jgi:hypothetical protein
MADYSSDPNAPYSVTPGQNVQGVNINDNRRLFDFGERVAELAPQQSPFFTYLSKVAKASTDDPVFKFLEQRHQWQRRNVIVKTEISATNMAKEVGAVLGANLVVQAEYDKHGRIGNANKDAAYFILPGQVIALKQDNGDIVHVKIANTPATAIAHVDAVQGTSDGHTTIAAADCTIQGTATAASSKLLALAKGQVVGSAWAEGSADPDGFRDELWDREGYCQIFKTAIPMFSGTALATRYRGKADEYKRVWTEKLMEHKMDLEHAFLFGKGVSDETTTGAPLRYSWGILPYTEAYGKIYNMAYASSGYDAFMDAMEDFFAPESGNSGSKLVLASRKVISYLNKLGSGSFLNNSVGSSQYRLDVTSIPGNFGHQVTRVNTVFGDLHFVADPLLRGMWEDYCVCVDMNNVKYRPLVGNGVSRDTHIITNVQANDIDGRKDIIMTEAGLEIDLPETHAIIKWS